MTLGLYASGLVFATNLAAADEAPIRREAQPATPSVIAVDQSESPLATLALAAAAAGVFGTWRLVNVARQARPIPVRAVGRRISTQT